MTIDTQPGTPDAGGETLFDVGAPGDGDVSVENTPQDTGGADDAVGGGEKTVAADAPAAPDTAGDKNAAPKDAASTLKIGDTDVQVSAEVAKHVQDLEGRLAESGKNQVPDGGYELNVPEKLAGQIQADANDPRVASLFEIAKANNWPQSVVDGVVALEYQNQVQAAEADTQAHANEKATLVKMIDPDGALGEAGALKKAGEDGQWLVSLLANDIKTNPGIQDEIKFLSTTANGWAVMKAIRDSVGVGAVPRPADASASASNPFASDTFNLTEQAKLVRGNPDLAQTLKAQAASA